jgi:uncharacterized membrane protein
MSEENEVEDEGSAAMGFLYMTLMFAILATTITAVFFGGAWWWPVLFFAGLMMAVYVPRWDQIKKAWEDAKNEKE